VLKSVWALELLLLLRRERCRCWSADDLNRELRASPGLVAEILGTLTSAGLVGEEAENRYRYQPATAELERLAEELEAAYAARPLAVVHAILAAPNEKIRTFADAFRFKRD
jgi:hypothetical protein